MSNIANRSILVVDDDDSLIQLITQVLSIYDISYDTATSGVEALEKINKKFYPMVISDVQMPEMNGIELLKAIKTGQKNSLLKSKVTLMTAYSSGDIIDQAKEYGMDYFLQKPFEISKLVKHIQVTLDDQ